MAYQRIINTKQLWKTKLAWFILILAWGIFTSCSETHLSTKTTISTLTQQVVPQTPETISAEIIKQEYLPKHKVVTEFQNLPNGQKIAARQLIVLIKDKVNISQCETLIKSKDWKIVGYNKELWKLQIEINSNDLNVLEESIIFLEKTDLFSAVFKNYINSID